MDEEYASDWASRAITNAETPADILWALTVIRVDEDFAEFESIDSHGGFSRYRPRVQWVMLRMKEANPKFPDVPTSENSVDYVNWCINAGAASEMEELPPEIASILKRGDFPTLADDEYAKLGAWLTVNARKHYDGLDAESLAKTRRMEETKTRLRAILQYNAVLRQQDTPPDNNNDADTSATGMTWQDVQGKLLVMYENGEPYTTVNDLAARLGCGKTTLHKAIKNSAKLKGWQARHTPASPKAQGLNPVVMDSAQSKVDDPAKVLTDDDVENTFARLVQEAKPDERAKLNSLTPEQRRNLVKTVQEQNYDQLIEDRAKKGNRRLGRKP